MSASIVKVIPKDGTGYDVNDTGATDISLRFQVQLSEALGQGQLFTTFSDGTTSIPAIGTVHPARPGYYVAKYEVRQPQGAAKNTLDVTVKYAAQSFVTEGGGGKAHQQRAHRRRVKSGQQAGDSWAAVPERDKETDFIAREDCQEYRKDSGKHRGGRRATCRD